MNAIVELWAQDNNYGKRINASLAGVQFAKDGEAFAGGTVAIGTSLIAVAAFGLTTAANYAASGLLDFALAGSFIAGGVVGSVLGAMAAKRLAAAKGLLNTLFAGLIVVVALYMLYRTWVSFTA